MLIDSAPRLGGNSAKASSGINAALTPAQTAYEEEHGALEGRDSVELFESDTLHSCVSTDEGVVGGEAASTASTATASKKQSKAGHAADEKTEEEDKYTLTPLMKSRVNILVRESASAISFLEAHGVTPLGRLARLGGHSRARTHRPSPVANRPTLPVGVSITSGLQTHLNTLAARLKPQQSFLHSTAAGSSSSSATPTSASDDNAASLSFEILTDTALVDVDVVLSGNGSDSSKHQRRVTGVTVKSTKATTLSSTSSSSSASSSPSSSSSPASTLRLPCDAVVLASGGFGASREMVQRYNPSMAKLSLPTTNAPLTLGHGMVAAERAGAELVDMKEIQVHPTSFMQASNPDAQEKFLAPEALRGVGGILITKDGKRFANELGTRDYVARNIQALPRSYVIKTKATVPGTSATPATSTTPVTSTAPVTSSSVPTSEKRERSASPSHVAFLILPDVAADAFGAPAIAFYTKMGLMAPVTFTPVDVASSKQEGGAVLSTSSACSSSSSSAGDGASGSPDVELPYTLLARHMLSLVEPATTAVPTTDDVAVDVASDLEVQRLARQLKCTIESYVALGQGEGKDEFGRTFFANSHGFDISYSSSSSSSSSPSSSSSSPSLSSSSAVPQRVFYVMMVTPAIHYTMGGVQVDEHGRVLTKQQHSQHQHQGQQGQQQHGEGSGASTPLPGLFGAGEVTGGLHGRNRLGGNSLLDCVVSGRRAGAASLAYVITGESRDEKEKGKEKGKDGGDVATER